MELDQLRSFLMVAELGSFTRAADECSISQPALSQRIAKLEKELGRPVFDRIGKTVQLTEAGRLLRPGAERLLALASDLAREVADDDQSGRIVVGAIPTIAPYLLPSLLREFRALAPRARVEVDEAMTEVLLKRTQRGEIDVGVLALPIESSGDLTIEALFDEELFLALPTDHLLRETEKVSIEAIQEEPFVLLGDGHCLSDQIRNFCRQRQFQPIVTGRTGQLATVQELVALGHGISFIPAMARRVDASPQRLYRPITGDPPRRIIAACWNPSRYQPALARTFLNILRRYQPTAIDSKLLRNGAE